MMMPVVIMMVMPAQAIDFPGSAQCLNQPVFALVFAGDSGDFGVVGVAVNFARHFVVMILMGMFVVMFVGVLVSMFVIGVLVLGMLVSVFVGVLVSVFVGVLVVMFVGVLVVMLVGVLVSVFVVMFVGVLVVFVSVLVVMFVGVLVVFVSVFVVMFVVMFVGMLVIMLSMLILAMFIMCRFGTKGNNPNASRCIDDIAAFARALHSFQQALFPTSAIDQDQIGFGNRRQIAGRGNKPMLINPYWNERTDLSMIARDIAYNIRENAVRRHNVKLIAIRKQCAAWQQHSNYN